MICGYIMFWQGKRTSLDGCTLSDGVLYILLILRNLKITSNYFYMKTDGGIIKSFCKEKIVRSDENE